MNQAPTETAVIRPALPEFAATVEPMFNYGTGRDGFAIRKADGTLYTVPGPYGAGYPLYETVADAQAFIDEGGLIEIELVDQAAVLAACGWDEEAGYCEANFARFRAYCQAEGIHSYAADRENYSLWIAKREAQRLGLRKLFTEDLS